MWEPRAAAEHSSLSVNQLTFLPPPTIYLSGDPRDATKSADLRGRRREAKKEGREDERARPEKERARERLIARFSTEVACRRCWDWEGEGCHARQS